MIEADPSIEDDVPGFIERMNLRDMNQTVEIKMLTETENRMVSIADLNGGECTQKNVEDALNEIRKIPLYEAALALHDKNIRDIEAGVITSVDDLADDVVVP